MNHSLHWGALRDSDVQVHSWGLMSGLQVLIRVQRHHFHQEVLRAWLTLHTLNECADSFRVSHLRPIIPSVWVHGLQYSRNQAERLCLWVHEIESLMLRCQRLSCHVWIDVCSSSSSVLILGFIEKILPFKIRFDCWNDNTHIKIIKNPAQIKNGAWIRS